MKESATTMPSHVRAFFWIVVALIIYWILSMIWHLVELESRHITGAYPVVIMGTAISCLVYLVPAWLAAFRRQNWARWTFAGIVVGIQILALLPLLYLTGPFRQAALGAYRHTMMRPRSIAVDAVLVVAIVFVFTGNAREWFKKPRVS